MLANINGVQSDYISSQGEIEGLDFEKIDVSALIHQEEKKSLFQKEGMVCCRVTAENDKIILWKASKLNWLEWDFL